jgi:hypothetical protein
MIYWKSLLSRHGFDDGDKVPVDAALARDVYCKAINALAEAAGSGYRAVPYTREGMLNNLGVVLCTASWYNQHYIPLLAAQGVGWRETPWLPVTRHNGPPESEQVTMAGVDETFLEAVKAADHRNLDRHIKIVAVLDVPGFAAEMYELTKK